MSENLKHRTMGRFPALISACKRRDDQIQKFQNTSLVAQIRKRKQKGVEVGLPRFMLGDPPNLKEATPDGE
jgi:hypothetical protein